MEGFMIRGWDLVLSGWRWLYEPQPVSDQPEGLGFHNMRGGIDPENHRFRPRFVRAACGRISNPGMGPYSARVALALRTQANTLSDSGLGVSAPCGAVSTRGASVFVSGLSGVADLWKDF